jgi:hypothetical protein
MDDFQENLCRRINERMEARGFCVVYDSDLSRLSRPLVELRTRQIRDIQAFAAEHRFAVTIRDTGLIATFTKMASTPQVAAEKAT